MTALRFLGLVDNEGLPTVRLRQLASSRGTQRSEVLKQVSNSAFDFLADKSIDPQVATYAQLEEAFHDNYSVAGDVARKCIKFFISLQSDAGVSLSSFILKKSRAPRTTAGGKRKSSIRTDARTNRNDVVPQANGLFSGQNNWYEMVLAKFPTFDPTWPDDVKLKWFESFKQLLSKEASPDTE